MPISGRHDDPILEQFARDTFALFPICRRCGQRVASFEEADVRVHSQRVVHRESCPPADTVERLVAPETPYP
ncbi:hypothetical protein BH11GEM2_BH11GEM2_16290 [soil metagenome]